MEAKELVIVIPAYEPDGLLLELIDKLNTFFTGHMLVVVDDGSKDKTIFDSVRQKENVYLITHEENSGKGAALKTAFRYVKSLEKNYVIVTADSDGQHKPEDIYRVYNFYKKYNSGLVLGSRKFDCDIPARSSFGNNVARFLLRSTQAIRLNDTQTGLRAFGTELLDFLVDIKGNRYEYEMDMLTRARQRSIEIHEIAIETIYIDNNSSSHFRPVRDFSRICSVIMKYSIPVFISMITSILSFFLMRKVFRNVDISRTMSYLYSSLISGGLGLGVVLLVHASGYCYGNPFIFKNKKKFIFNLLTSLLFVIVMVGSGYGLYLALKSAAGAYILSIIIGGIVLWLELFFVAKHSKLYEE